MRCEGESGDEEEACVCVCVCVCGGTFGLVQIPPFSLHVNYSSPKIPCKRARNRSCCKQAVSVSVSVSACLCRNFVSVSISNVPGFVGLQCMSGR